MKARSLFIGVALSSLSLAVAAEQSSLPGTTPLALDGDVSALMVAGIDKFLSDQTAGCVAERRKHWQRDFSSREAYSKSVDPHRGRLRKMIGAVDKRQPCRHLEFIENTSTPALVAEMESYTIHRVRWPVFEGVHAEGLWLQPRTKALARVIALPDADQSPEMIAGVAPGVEPERQFARRLAENGCEVLVPTLISRDDRFSGNAVLNRFTNQPHREWIYRQAYELGRHIIGYEVQKVAAAVDYFTSTANGSGNADSAPFSAPLKVGVAGYAEGGLIAFYSAALDTRIDAALVSGYFDSRQNIWAEPIYRNVFGLLQEFGDAEIATLIAPRTLIIEHSVVPDVPGPPAAREDRHGAAPGRLATPDSASVETEFERARTLMNYRTPTPSDPLKFIAGIEGGTTGPVSDRSMLLFLNALGAPGEKCRPPGEASQPTHPTPTEPQARQEAQLRELEQFTQKLFRESEDTRATGFWKLVAARSPQEWASACAPLRERFNKEIMGTFGPPVLPPNPRARQVAEGPKWTGYEVVLDVYPQVIAWGYLLVPKDLKPGERRPAVVCQHGLEGVPADVINEDPNSQAYRYYKAFAARLAASGFVVFAPHNPYRGGDKFRVLQRKANPLGASIFSIIIAQHSRVLDWLAGLPFVAPERIGFYGLSYGGKTAMRVPAVLEKYALSICSGDFNEWVQKNVSVDSPISYMFTGEYEMPEWNLGDTFNYAEMAALIAPRPFMVERGHSDGVGLDEWVAYEYAKVRRFYAQLGIPDRTSIEFFNGPHTINGVGTFEFLRKHLGWDTPQPR